MERFLKLFAAMLFVGYVSLYVVGSFGAGSFNVNEWGEARGFVAFLGVIWFFTAAFAVAIFGDD